jgi:phospholipase C
MRVSYLFPSLCLVAACSNSQTVLPGPPEWNRPVTAPADDDAKAQRAACGYKAGSLPAETQGKSHPNGTQIPIDHIVVIMMENRSFDHYFQKLPENGQPDAEVAPATFTNNDLDGKPVSPYHDEQLCFVDTAHGWNAVHDQINGGKMDGFFRTNDGTHEMPMGGSLELLSGKRGMTYYEPADLPFMYWAANEYAIADHYHCSVPGPTWPNRMFLYAATSRGKTSNVFLMNDENTLFDVLQQRKVNWTIYSYGLPGFGMFIDRYSYYLGGDDGGDRIKVFTKDFFADAAAGKLPEVAFLDPNLGHEAPGSNDEHPPSVMHVGQQWLAQVVDAIAKSPNWASTAIFITYDEHGGLYDHVVPPAACPPDDYPAELGPTDTKAAFDQLGPRVPLVVISPYAKKKYVGHHVYDHTSIVRFIEARFVLPAMTARDANAEAPWDLFDFEKPPNKTPPSSVPMPTVDDAKIAACVAQLPPG